MKIYRIDYTNIALAKLALDNLTNLIANDCNDVALESIQEARNLLQNFSNEFNLVEDNNITDGIVLQSDAKAAIKEAVEETTAKFRAVLQMEKIREDGAGLYTLGYETAANKACDIFNKAIDAMGEVFGDKTCDIKEQFKKCLFEDSNKIND